MAMLLPTSVFETSLFALKSVNKQLIAVLQQIIHTNSQSKAKQRLHHSLYLRGKIIT